uniref:LAGLIDADG endonuclease n=1 Tax=Phellinus igniarius TaxID=40472 RepID=UPI00233E6C08|nr:LAGLIDADG endonuclease [Phellinus igniarius]WBU93187.1 LAGLIDADG endonuclease [Phellinus igniarius]
MGLTVSRLFAFIISFIISVLISSFIVNNYKFSNNKLVRFLQKFVLFNILFIVALIICDCFNINLISQASCEGTDDNNSNNNTNSSNDSINNSSNNSNNNNINNNNSNNTSDENLNSNNDKKIFSASLIEKEGQRMYKLEVEKETGDNLISAGKDIAVEGGKKIAPYIGAGAASGKAAVAAFKATAGMPPLQRGAVIAGVSGVTTAGTILGLEAGKAIVENANFSDSIKNSKHGDPNVERIPSPDQDMIPCIIESGDAHIPLLTLLNALFTFNVLEIILLIILLVILFNKYIYKLNMTILSNLINKYFSKNIIAWFNKYSATSVEINEKFTKIMLIYISIVLILFKLGTLYITYELGMNIDDYVLVYNHIKNISKNSIIFIGLQNNLFNKKQLNCKFSTSCFNKFNVKNNVIFNNNNIDKNIPNDNIYSGDKPVVILDNSNSKSINSKINGIYKVYENLYLNNNFENNLSEIMEDLYDNNEHTVFKLFFIRKFTKKYTKKLDLVKFVDHLSKYPTETLRFNNCKVYKNTGLFYSFELLVFLSLCDFDNLMNISKNVKKEIITNVEAINVNLPLEQFNTILNYCDEFKFNEEITLIIQADFDKINKFI